VAIGAEPGSASAIRQAAYHIVSRTASTSM
jgi:hypothetical protein